MQRLHCSQDIEQMFREGKLISKEGLQMRVKANDCGDIRLGIIIPKKRVPLAVKRNRTKRLLREAWLSVVTEYHISGLDVLLIVVNKKHPRSFHEYRENLVHCSQTQFI